MALLLLDIDGPCADFTGHLLKWVGSDLTPEDITEWDVFDFMTSEESAEAKMALAGLRFWESQPVVPGAQDGVRRIRAAGHDIVVVTSPWESCLGWGSARKDWVSHNLGLSRRDVIIGARKDLVYGDAFIDDKASHIEAWQARHPEGKAFPFKAPYNPSATFEWSQAGEVVAFLDSIDRRTP